MTNKNDKFEFKIQHPEIGMLHLRLHQQVTDEIYKSMKCLFPWILAALLGGSGWIEINRANDSAPRRSAPQMELPSRVHSLGG